MKWQKIKGVRLRVQLGGKESEKETDWKQRGLHSEGKENNRLEEEGREDE